MFSIKNLKIIHNKTNHIILDQFSHNFHDHKITVLIGEEGSGKSSLLKVMTHRRCDYAKIKSDDFSDNKIIGYCDQNPSEDLSISEIFYQDINWEHLDYRRMSHLFKGFKLDEKILSSRSFNSLSGGEKTKLILIKELLKNPDILILDEPTNNLDLKSIKFLESILKEQTCPVVIASHDRMFIDTLADEIIHLEQTHRRTKSAYTVYNTNYSGFLEQRSAALTKQVSLHQKEKEDLNQAKARYEKIHDRVHHELNAVSRQDPLAAKNLKDKMRSVKSVSKKLTKQEENMTEKPDVEKQIDFIFRSTYEVHESKEILTLKDYCLKVEENILVPSLTLSIVGKEKIAISGDNGIGKTTLLNTIKQTLTKQGFKLAWMPQDYAEVFNTKLSPLELLADIKIKEEKTQAMTYLGSLNFSEKEMTESFESLSGGQKAKLFFAKMSLTPYDILLLDEPNRNISPLSMETLTQQLKDFEGPIIMVTHDRQLIKDLNPKVYELSQKGLILQ